MKVYQLTIVVIDFDGVGAEGAASNIESARYPNHCIAPRVTGVAEAEIGEWRDDHPLNNAATRDAELARLFSDDTEDA